MMKEEYDYSEIIEEADFLLKDVEDRIKLYLKESNECYRLAMRQNNQIRAIEESREVLGYEKSLECIKRTREKFSINSKPQADKKSVS